MIQKILLIPYMRGNGKIFFFVGLGQYNHVWRFPTGHVGDEKCNARESILSCARRELREELGVDKHCKVVETGLSQIFLQKHQIERRSGEVRETVFVVDITGQDTKIQSEEFLDHKFLPYNDAISILHYSKHKEFLQKIYPAIVSDSLKD